MRTLTLSLLALMLLSLPTIAQDAKPEEPNKKGFEEREAQAKANVEVLDGIFKIMKARFYDKTFGGQDLADMRKRFLKRVRRAQPGEDLHKVLREMLAEFKVSHLSVVEKEAYDVHFVPEMNDTKTLQTGIELTEYEDGLYVSNVLHGSAGDKAGILRGDQFHLINGKLPAGSGRLVDAGGDPGLPSKQHYFLHFEEGETLIPHISRPMNGEFHTFPIRIK
ncbi:MAG: PDZ domain-containing protein, partial [Planctomycetota bacterium]